MSALNDLTGFSSGVGSRHDTHRELLARGTVVQAPATASDALVVELKNYTSDYPYEVAPGSWIAAGGLPAAGDLCLVGFDDDGDAWAWVGSAPPGGGAAGGAAAPSDSVGADGSFWIDTAALTVWGPKAAGHWPAAPFARLLPTGTATWSEVAHG